MILNEDDVVYSISFSNIGVSHASEPYIDRYFFKSSRFTIVDTSETAGPYPIIIDAKKVDHGVSPISGCYTSYNSDIIKKK